MPHFGTPIEPLPIRTLNRFRYLCATFALAFLAGGLAAAQNAQPHATLTQTTGNVPSTASQTEQVLPSYEGQHVTTVELAGQPNLDTAAFVPLLAQHAGEPFSLANVDKTIAALKRAGKFEDVELEIRPDPNGIRVLFILQPAVYFGIYEFPGALGSFSYSRLLQITNYPPRGAYTPVDVQEAVNSLQTFLRRGGYFQAQIRPQIEMHQQYGLADVIFNVTLNRRAKFGNIIITGPTPQETARLQHELRSIMARLRRAAIRPGKTYRLKTLQNATRYLEAKLTKQNRLAAKVELVGANYDPNTNRADINFHVQPGPVINAKINGAGFIWPWTRRKLLPIYAGIGVDPELIQEGRQNLVSYMQSKGYFDAQVTSQVQQQSGNESIVYQVTKGPRHKVAGVHIAGNQHMPGDELMTHVTVRKGGLLSHGKYSQKLVRTSAKNLTAIYKAAGYSSVKVVPQVTNKEGNIVVTFRVDEGPQDLVEALRVEGNRTLPESQFAPRGLKVSPGQPYSQKLVDEDRTQILAHYLELGYLTASLRATARQLPHQPHRLEVVYDIYEGPRVRTAQVITLGRRHTQQKLIARNTGEIQTEKPLTENDLFSAESRLYTLPGVFDWAEIDPRRQITTQTEEDVLIKVHEAKRNSIVYGFGFEVINRGGSVPSGTVAVPGLPPVGLKSNFRTSQKTFWGPRGTFEYTRNNLRGKGESFTIAGLAGRLDQRGSITYTDPNFRWTNWTSNLSLTGEHNSQNPIFTSRQAQSAFQLQRAINRDKTQNIFLRYSFSQTGLTRLLIPELVPPADRHVRLSTLAATYVRDTRDNALDAHRGIYQTAEVDLNPAALGSNVSFARLNTQAAYYKRIPSGAIWANSIRIGLEAPFAGSRVPLSEEFFSGGGSTLRGFPLNGAGPQRSITACGDPHDRSTCSPITVPVGGRQLLIINSELRIPVPFSLPLIKKGLSVVPFYDGGNVYQHVGFGDVGRFYTNNVGFGIRYATPVGPIRVDIGHNLDKIPGIKSTQVFIGIGQAF